MTVECTLFVGGYIACIFTWPKIKEWFNGAETEIRALEDRARALKDKLRAAL